MRPINGKIAATLFLSLFMLGCYQHFFRTHTQHQVDEQLIQRLRSSGKFFILHFSDSTLHLQNVAVQGSNITGKLAPVQGKHLKYLNPDSSGNNHVKKADKPTALMEVHIYTGNQKKNVETIAIPLSDISRIDVYQLDERTGRANAIYSTAGLVLGVAIIVSLIVASQIALF